jgi:hypothetical protein
VVVTRSDIAPIIGILALTVVVRVLSHQGEKRPAVQKPTGAWAGLWFLSLLGGVYAAGFTLLGVGTGAWPLVPLFGALSLALLWPWTLARHVFARLGWPRAAYWVTRVAHWRWETQKRDGAVVAGCLALRRRPDPARLEWLEARLGKAGGVTPLALALIADLRGQREEARRLMALCAWFDRRVLPPGARRMAREWLAADAAARGEWADVARYGGRFLAGAARRLLGAPDAPSDRRLRLLWVLSRGRRALRPLLDRATGRPAASGHHASLGDPPAPGPLAPGVSDGGPLAPGVHASDGGPLGRAVALTAALRRAPDARLLRAAGDAWAAAFSDEAVQSSLRTRAEALGAVDPARAAAAVREAAVAMLATAAEDLDLRAVEGEPSTVLATALQRAADARLAALEQLARGPQQRAARDAPLPAADELREWAALLAEYDRAARLGRQVEQLAFEQVHAAVCNLAVSLFNTWGERRLANAMFRWLQDRARALGLSHLDELYTRNVACGL